MSHTNGPFHRIRTVIDATRAAIADPEDTAQAFRIAEALSFNAPNRMLARFRADRDGARLLCQRDDILAVLQDRETIAAMPEGSLGRAYLAFLDSEGITAQGLVEASQDGFGDEIDASDGDDAFVRRRMRDTHDLWHTVTGYKGDLLGEASLLAFTFAQTHHPGVGFLAGIGLVLADDARVRPMIVDGFLRGRRARWLPPTDWAELLPMPLDQVRERLGVEPVGDYEPVRERPAAMMTA